MATHVRPTRLGLEHFDGLRLCSQIRSLDRTRSVPILVITEMEDTARLLRGLEIGINDYLVRPIDRNEMLARVRVGSEKDGKRYALADGFERLVRVEKATADDWPWTATDALDAPPPPQASK